MDIAKLSYHGQGATLAFDLLNGTAMGWLYVRMNGLPPQAQQIDAASAQGQGNPGGPPQPSAGSTPEHITTDFCSRSQAGERISPEGRSFVSPFISIESRISGPFCQDNPTSRG